MVRAITIEELEAARDRYAEEVRKLEETAKSTVRNNRRTDFYLIETLEALRDQCTAMISSFGGPPN
jgi:hypothetical protein